MYKMMKRCLSLCLTLCILMMAMPSIGLSEEGAAVETTPAAAETTTAAVETTPAAVETTSAAVETTPAAVETTTAAAETTPAAAETTTAAAETTTAAVETTTAAVETTTAAVETTPAAVETTTAAVETTTAAVETTPAAAETTPAAAETTPAAAETTPAAAETTTAPTPVIVELTGAPEAMEAMYGLYEDELDLPETLTAVYSDGARAELPVTWVCISDGLGGTAYDGECEDYEQACFTFEARLPEGALCAEDLTLPRVQVRLVLPDLGIALYTAADEVTITNTHGVLSYTVPEGVTVKGQQWLKNSTEIAGATDTTYKLTMSDMKDKNNSFSVRLTLEDGSEVTSSVGYAMSANDQWGLGGSALRFNNDYAQNTTDFPLNNNEIHEIIGPIDLNVSVESGVSVSGVTLTCGVLENHGTITDSTLEIKRALGNFGTIYGCEFPNSGGATVNVAGTLHVPVTINGTVYKSKPGDSLQFLYGENTYDALKSWYEANCGTYEPEYVLFLYNDGQNTRVNGDMLLGLSNSFNVPYCTIEAPDGFVSGATVRASVQPAIYDSLDYSWFAGSTKLSDGSTAVLPDIDPGASAKIDLYVTLDMTIDGQPGDYWPIRASATFSGMAQAEGVLPVITNTNGTLSYSCTLPDGVSVEKQQWLKNGSPISGATDASYTLTMDDMKNRDNVLSVRLTLNNSTVATSAGYAMSANDEWKMVAMALAFTGSYDQKTTDFPLKLADIEFEYVRVESGASVSGVNLSCNNLTNRGTISNSTLQLMVNLDNSGTISGSSLTVNGWLYNSGVIYKSGIDCGNVNKVENGVIHVRVTINGEDCSSTPDTSWQFLWGDKALTALNAWYAKKHPGASTDGLYWVMAGDDTPYFEFNDFELQYSMQCNFVCLRCSIEAPEGLVSGAQVRAGFEAPKGYTADYTWYHDGEQFATGSEAELPQLKPGASATVELQVSNIKTSDGNSVVGGLSASATFSGIAYDVTVDYEGDALVITPRDGVTIEGALVQVGNSQFAGAPVDGKCTLPLSYFGDGSFDASLTVYGENFVQLAGPTSLHLSRAAANVDPADFSFTVAESANAGDARDVTVHCANPDKYNAIRVGEKILDAAETVSCKVEPGADVTLYARTPGSEADEMLPSPWVEVGTIEASKWLHLNVSSQHRFSGDNGLFWGEVLKIETNLSAAELKWTINGAAVAPPALDGGMYTIPANVSSLSITATDSSGSITRELSDIECPVIFGLNYENEALTFFRKDICPATIQAHIGTKDYTLDDTYGRSYPLSDSGLPKNEAAALDVTLESNGSSVSIPIAIPARFAGQVIEDSVSYCQPMGDFDYDSGTWGCGWIRTQDGDGVAYAAVKLEGPSLVQILSRDSTGKWVPPADSPFGMIVGSTYSIYAKQYSVDAAGRQNSFASDWFDTGVRIKAGEIELSTYAPLVGDTVTATPKFFCPESSDWWSWSYSGGDEGASGVGSDGRSSFTILPYSDYANRRLTVNMYNRDAQRLMGYAETEVIPAPEIVIRREDGTELKKDASGEYIAYLGDKLTAEVKNVSQDFLKDADEVEWTWESVGPAGSFTTGTSSLELDKDLFSYFTRSDVFVMLKKGTDEINLKRRVRIYVAPAPDVQIDYENETLVVVKPANELIADYDLYMTSTEGGEYTVESENNVYTVPISEINEYWPDGSAYRLSAKWNPKPTNSAPPSSESVTFTIPARPTVQKPDTASTAFAITVEGVSTQAYNLRLTAADAASQDADAVATPTDVNGNVKFTGLESNTTYRLWVQKKATDSAFRSEWTSFDVETIAATELVPSLTWTTTYDPTDFSLSAEDVLNRVTFAEKTTGLRVMIERGSVTLTRADGKPFPITDAGTYSLKLTLVGDAADYFKLSTDTVTLTVQPYEVSSFDFDGSKTYTGAAYDPYDFEVRVGERVLTKDDYTITVDGGATLRDAGTYTARITFKGNFSGSFSVKLTIKEKAPAATATPAPLFAPISDEVLQMHLNGMASLVFDAAYNPVDYELIPVLVSGEAEENILLICADQEDEPAQRSLILNAAQLVKLQQVLQENEIGDLIFENGSAAARMNLAELTGGNMAKLMALILSGGEITEEILQSDWSAMEDAALTEAEYERFSLEVRIVPVVQEDGEQGYEISVWLRCDALNLNVSDLIDSLCVMLDVSRLVTAENAGTFDDLYAVARKNGEESELLDSALVLAPTVSEDGDAAESAPPMVAGRYALTALYAGEGMYRIVSVDA